MLVLFLIHLLSARALPVPAANEATPPSCEDINYCRTVLNIIWSCLSTIFLCTWVAVHPNISEPVDIRYVSAPNRKHTGWWERIIYRISCLRRKSIDTLPHLRSKMLGFLRNQVLLFIIALLAPEYILAWAVRQYLMAGKIRNEIESVAQGKNRIEITRAHGFFVIMGGFHYFKGFNEEGAPDKATEDLTGDQVLTNSLGHNSRKIVPRHGENQINEEVNGYTTSIRDRPIHPLSWRDVVGMVEDGQIQLPTVEEIQDKSKSDWFAKTLVLLQTLWFVTQCIARRIQHLPTTELEIVTVAYTAVNLGIFLAWLDKPRNVECPIHVFQEPTEKDNAEERPRFERILMRVFGGQDGWVDLHKKRQVPMFYSGRPSRRTISTADAITVLAGVIFGAIHCIAWSFEFPSHTELVLWRISSISITAIPVVLGIYGVLILEKVISPFIRDFRRLSLWVQILAFPIPLILYTILFSMFLCVFLYPVARLTTLVLAFRSLSSLPPGAFEAVSWTTFVPHL